MWRRPLMQRSGTKRVRRLRNATLHCQRYYSSPSESSNPYDYVKELSRWESLVSWKESLDDKPNSTTGWVVPVVIDSEEWKDLSSQHPELLKTPSGLLGQMNFIPLHEGTVLCVPIPSESNIRSPVSSGRPRAPGMKRIIKALQLAGCHLPCAEYHLRLPEDSTLREADFLLSYLMDSYSFDHYNTKEKLKNITCSPSSKLCVRPSDRTMEVSTLVRATYLTQDLISTPACYLTPGRLQQVVEHWARENSNCISLETVVGTELLKYNGSLPDGHGCGMIYAVGQAASGTSDDDRQPRLIRLQYRPRTASVSTVDTTFSKLALVGKGVTYDTGGLNLKPGSSMLHMKKDMGGAAHVLGLLNALVEQQFPVPIDVWIPTVENVLDANSYRPGDVVTSVMGTTTEIGNTDAEGRLILGDALALASAEEPDLIVDFATLTGAARVAMGTDVVPYFCNDDSMTLQLLEAAGLAQDPMWPMPLHEEYRKRITKSSKIADLRNVPSDNGLGGAITAALYLQEFVGEGVPWIHCDVYGLERTSGIGRAQGLRAMYRFLWDRYRATLESS